MILMKLCITDMERFEDFVIENEPDHWLVEAWDNVQEDVKRIEISYWDMIDFFRFEYQYSKSEAIEILAKCDSDQEEYYCKQYFLNKMK